MLPLLHLSLEDSGALWFIETCDFEYLRRVEPRIRAPPHDGDTLAHPERVGKVKQRANWWRGGLTSRTRVSRCRWPSVRCGPHEEVGHGGDAKNGTLNIWLSGMIGPAGRVEEKGRLLDAGTTLLAAHDVADVVWTRAPTTTNNAMAVYYGLQKVSMGPSVDLSPLAKLRLADAYTHRK